MKSFSAIFASQKENGGEKQIDEKTIFHVFSRVIVEEYGVQGQRNIKPRYYKDHSIFLSFNKSLWAQEVWMQRESILMKVNDKLGQRVVHRIKTS